MKKLFDYVNNYFHDLDVQQNIDKTVHRIDVFAVFVV